MSWRILSEERTSKGLLARRASSLADLHRRRQETQAQYFTPAWVARGIWQALREVTAQAERTNHALSVIDTSCGSGRLFEGAPTDCLLYGLDTDRSCIEALSADAAAAERLYHFEHGSMANATLSGFDIAVINPPYSLLLESPNLTPFDCTSFGKYGPNSHALSHEYALYQALECAKYVVAVLPETMDPTCKAIDSFLMKVKLPAGTFLSEGANVMTAVYFFGNGTRQEDRVVSPSDQWPAISLRALLFSRKPRLSMTGVDLGEKTISLPVTGNQRVELHHHNRRIVLKYHCGLVMARVANAVLQAPARAVRLPSSVRYAGDGRLLLDVLLLQDSPADAFDSLLAQIRAAGGSPWVSPTLAGFFAKLIRRHRRVMVPFRRSVKESDDQQVTLVTRQRTLLSPLDLNSPSIAKGEAIRAAFVDGSYVIVHGEYQYSFRRDEIERRFEIACAANPTQWMVKFDGKAAAFPQLSQAWGKVINQQGITWLASFQRESVIEGLISPYGYIGGWEQGSGKARYAIALALCHPGRNLIVVESGLLPELKRELAKLDIPAKKWEVLTRYSRPTRKITVVSYRTLRHGTRVTVENKKKVLRSKVLRSNAEMWRRQFNTVICDEGGLLANSATQQSQAIRRLAGRKVIVLDGTPQRNYPRDLLPLAAITAGNGVAHQPFGLRGKPYLQSWMFNSMNQCQRGEDHFFDQHVVTQWVTWEFKEDMTKGAKREVPKINHLPEFRTWLAPLLQRRLRAEPELAEFSNCPRPERSLLTVEWEPEHFRHYLSVAIEFANYYREMKKSNSSKALNLVAILARLGAVQRAANAPHMHSETSMGVYLPVTSKQRAAINRVKHWVKAGRKVIVYAKNPSVLERLAGLLKEQQIESVLFTGEQNIEQRTLDLDSQFRFGSVPVLLSSWVGQRGLNLEQASVALFYERDWSAVTEEQAIARMLRPAQRQQVMVEYLHLRGSIDDYCAQLVEWKAAAADAGLDYGEQVGCEDEFLHLDQILNAFCEDVLGHGAHQAHRRLCG